MKKRILCLALVMLMAVMMLPRAMGEESVNSQDTESVILDYDYNKEFFDDEIISAAAPNDGLGPVFITGKRDFKWPLNGYHNIKSCFYDKRNHRALDFAAPTETAVYAAYDGTVVKVVDGGTSYHGDGYGNYVVVEHNGYVLTNGDRVKLYSKYNHLNSAAISEGKPVQAGVTKIGYVGATGTADGAHLDFQIFYNESSQNNSWTSINNSIDPYSNQLLVLPSDIQITDDWDCGKDYYAKVKAIYDVPQVYGSPMTTGTGQTIPDGVYLITNIADPSYYVDIEGTAYPAVNSTNVSICGKLEIVPPVYECWDVTYCGDGFYSIKQMGTNLALDVYGGSKYQGANIQVYESNDSDAQRWSISPNGKNGYRIQAKCSGFSMNLKDGTIKTGTNIFMEPNNDSSAQAWAFFPRSLVFSFSAEGGSGQTDSINTFYNDTIMIPECGFSKSGNNFIGWVLEREDGMWFDLTSNSWISSAQFTQEVQYNSLFVPGTEHKIVDSYMKADAGKTENFTGHVFTFHAVWETYCEHSYGQQDIVADKSQDPTATEAGYYTFVCEKCGAEIVNHYPALNSTDYSIDHIKLPTCQEEGQDIYQFLGADFFNPAFYVNVPKIAHDFIASDNPPTCDSYASTTYTCSVCGDSYTVVTEDDLSEWLETKPSGVADEHIEVKTQYRYRDKETTTGNTDTMDGWTLEGTSTSWSDYGAWSNWSTNSVNASDSRQVETTTLYRYYYFYCPKCGRHEPLTGTSDCGNYTLSGNDWHEIWSPVAYSKSSYKTFSYTDQKYYTTSLGDGQTWCFSSGNVNATSVGTIDSTGSSVVIETGYRYRDRTQVTTYTFYRWGEWSEWSDEAYSASDTRQVETRTMYRYHTRPLTEHEWGEWTVTTPATVEQEGVETRTCAKCVKEETRPIPKISQFTVTFNANGGTNAPASQIKIAGSTLTLTNDKPVRNGYAFLGWATSADAAEAEYQPGDTLTENADITLYAVWSGPDLVLPAALTTIETEAFAGGAFRFAKLPETVTQIGSRAFADCPNLAYIYIPEATTSIASDAFSGVTGLTVYGAEGSYAEFYAQRHGFTFIAD